MGWGGALVVECVFSTCKALSLMPKSTPIKILFITLMILLNLQSLGGEGWGFSLVVEGLLGTLRALGSQDPSHFCSTRATQRKKEILAG